LGDLLDLLDVYDDELELIKAPAENLDLAGLYAGVLKLDELSIRSRNLKRDISMIHSGKKFASAAALRVEAWEGVKAQTKGIEKAQAVWQAAIDEQMALRINGEAVIYPTGQSLICSSCLFYNRRYRPSIRANPA
jgi:hypothetical protein